MYSQVPFSQYTVRHCTWKRFCCQNLLDSILQALRKCYKERDICWNGVKHSVHRLGSKGSTPLISFSRDQETRESILKNRNMVWTNVRIGVDTTDTFIIVTKSHDANVHQWHILQFQLFVEIPKQKRSSLPDTVVSLDRKLFNLINTTHFCGTRDKIPQFCFWYSS